MKLSYDPYDPASAFFAKPLTKVPYEGRRVRICASGPAEKAVRQYYKSVRPRMLNFQENLSASWSYDKILID